MSEKKAASEINDEVLKLVTGGNFVFDYSQCPCGRFRPYNGNPNNKQYSNCLYFVQAALAGGVDMCDENGVCLQRR